MQPLTGHTKGVRAVAFVPDGRLISGGEDRKLIIWDPRQAAAVQTIKAKQIVYAVAVSPDGNQFAYAGRNQTANDTSNNIKVWDLVENVAATELSWPRVEYRASEIPALVALQAAGIPVPALGYIGGSIWSLSYSADGKQLAGASRISGSGGDLDGSVARFYSVHDPDHPELLKESKVYAVAFAPTGTTIALTREGNVGVFDRPNGTELLSHKIQSSWAAAVIFVSGGDTLVIAASSYLHFVDLKGGAKPKKVKTGFRTITSLAVSPDGGRLLVGGRPETLEFYDVQSHGLQTKLDFELGAVYSVAFSPDGCTFAVGAAKGLMICDVP
jgi:WD40 repeat protein